MKNFALALFALAVFYSGCGQSSEPTDCNVPELVVGHNEYNDLVCRGIASLKIGDNQNAIALFQAAMDIRLFELPNFSLYSRLALAQHRAGRTELASQYLERARLSLLILTGALACEESDSGFFIIPYGERVDSDAATDVARRMCGAAYEYIYRDSTLETYADNAELVNVYLNVEKEIRTSTPSK